MLCKIKPVTLPNDEKASQTLVFAAEELQKYLGSVATDDFPVIPTDHYEKDTQNTIFLGVGLSDALPEVPDKRLDDAILIDVENFSGVITGTNARSVLIAVYRFLKEQGFSFLYPGKAGEIYPDTLKKDKVLLCEKASYRHRAVCIEGSVPQEALSNMIDWLPKAAMNGYYIQFQLPKTFFSRWYEEDTPYRDTPGLSDEEVMAIVRLAEKDMEKRSLLYHAVGHGWTCEPFGIHASSWESAHYDLTEEQISMLALVNGNRELAPGVNGGIPMNTNLCYSSPKVRKAMTDAIVDYCKSHSNVDFLHFWLADGTNNNCECEECRKKRTSDHYVTILNELDEKLTKAGLDTKIVFLIYVDLFWKPLTEKLKNKDRFTMMFAPITRSYSQSYADVTPGEVGPYVLNKLKFPKGIAENLAYLKDWQTVFDGDSFDYDYHFQWDHYYDFSYYNHAKIIHKDMQALRDIGMNGLISCQMQRVFLPTALGMNVLADTLWNRDLTFEEIAKEKLFAEFGENYKKVENYLADLSVYNCAKVLRGEVSPTCEETKENLKKALEILDAFEPEITKTLQDTADERLKKSWEKLAFHNQLYRLLFFHYLNVAEKRDIDIRPEIIDYAQQYAEKFRLEFDAPHFIDTLQRSITIRLNADFDTVIQ